MGSITPAIDLHEILTQLTLEEKVSLLAGLNFWQTVPIPRLNIPSVKVTDGPNGARGSVFFGGVKAACFPASVCVAATWDVDLARRIGNALAEEAKTKGASCLLGPTVCPHRSPLGGRNFESFSEDPLLAGQLASAYICGLQEKGVAATIKHYAANEQETKRFSMNVNVSERALREIYLKPFEIAVKNADPWALMTSYNIVNGIHADHNEHLLKTILRQQWGYKGLVMSDWGGTNSIAESINAGLDLEMPGPASRRKFEEVQKLIDCGAINPKSIDRSVLSVLKFIEKTGKFGEPEISEEKAVNDPAHQKLIRKAGAEGMVLLKNDRSILPLKAGELKCVAVFGQANECLAHGGGSAALTTHYKVTPYEALTSVFGDDVDLRYAPGAHIFYNLPDWTTDVFTPDGARGWTLSRYQTKNFSSEPHPPTQFFSTTFMAFEQPCQAARLEGIYRPSVSGNHYISIITLGPSKVYINNELFIEQDDSGSDPMAFLTGGSVELKKQYSFIKGEEYVVRIDSIAPTRELRGGIEDMVAGVLGLHVGFMEQESYEEDVIVKAKETAKSADVALVFVGRTPLWETEGHDMKSMDLPSSGSQDRLIDVVASVNPNTVVINSTGSAISMPWLSSIAALLQAWFPGQEAGNSIVDVLFGHVNPSGKLPISIPRRIEDTPSYGNFPGNLETLQVHYQEGVNIGYSFYDKNPENVVFPFGFGLSYSDFEFGGLVIESNVLTDKHSIKVRVDITNVSSRAGQEVVQSYIAPPRSVVDRPLKTLASFQKVYLEPKETKNVELEIWYDSAAFWDESTDLWKVEAGEYEILVGNSSANIVKRGKVVVRETFSYKP